MATYKLLTAWFPYYYVHGHNIFFFSKEGLRSGLVPESEALRTIYKAHHIPPETWFVFQDTRQGWENIKLIAQFESKEALIGFLKLAYNVDFP